MDKYYKYMMIESVAKLEEDLSEYSAYIKGQNKQVSSMLAKHSRQVKCAGA